MIGVYAIVHRETGRRYIGSSKNIEHRWVEHLKCLKKGTHHSRYLQFTWAKHGAESFDFVIVEECQEPELRVREQAWLDWAQAADGIHGFNMSSTADRPTMSADGRARMGEKSRIRMTGVKRGPMSAQGRANISKARTGRKFGPRDPSIGLKIAAALRGQPFTEERKARISASNTGRPKGRQSEIHKDRIRQASLKHRHSSESLAKIKSNHWSHSPRAAEIAARISQSHKARALPVEVRATQEVA